MTMQELFKSCAKYGEFPKVKVDKPVRYSDQTVGHVMEVTPYGIAVQFMDLKHTKWFHNNDGRDKRKNYMRDLTLIEKK